MSGENYQKVSNWKIVLVLMIIVWLANIMMSFVYNAQIDFFMFTWLTNIFLSFVETILLAFLCYVFYLLFWRKSRNDRELEDNNAQ